MQGFMKMEWSFVSTLLSRILQVIGMCLVVFVFFPKQHIIAYETPFYWILFAGTIAALCQLILNWWYANRIEKIQFLFDRKYLKKLFFESLPYGVALFLSVVYFKIDIVLLSFLEPKDVANHSIAMYSLPMKIVEVLMVLGVFYLNSLLPSLSEAFHQNNTEKVKHLLTKSFEVLFAF